MADYQPNGRATGMFLWKTDATVHLNLIICFSVELGRTCIEQHSAVIQVISHQIQVKILGSSYLLGYLSCYAVPKKQNLLKVTLQMGEADNFFISCHDFHLMEQSAWDGQESPHSSFISQNVQNIYSCGCFYKVIRIAL